MPISAIGIPQSSRPNAKSEASRCRPTRANAATAPSRPPIPTAEFRKPTPACPRSSSSSEATTIRTLSEPATNVWIPYKVTISDNFRSLAIAPKPPKNSRMKLPSTSRSGAASTFSPTSRADATTKATAAAAKTVCVFVAAKQDPAERGAEEDPGALDGRQDEVRRGQLLGRLRELGKQCGLHRAHRARHQRDASAQRVDEPVRPACKEDERGRGHEAGPDEREDDEQELAAVAVAEHSGEGRRDEGRQDADHADEPDPGRAALVVCVDGQRDDERPVRSDRSRPGELDAAQRGIGDHGPERIHRFPEPLAERTEHTRTIAGSRRRD